MKHYVFILLICAATCAYGEQLSIMLVEDALRQNLLLRHPRPEYAYEARRKGITGSGVFLLRFDYESGRLRQVHIARSTGSAILDDGVVAGLKQWQAKPHSLHVIQISLTFTTSRSPR